MRLMTSPGSSLTLFCCRSFRSKRYWPSANATHGQCLLAMSRSFWKRHSVGSTLRHENSLQNRSNVLRSMRPRSGAGPPSSEYTRSRSVRREIKEKEGHDFETAFSLFSPVGLIAERAGSPFALSSSISPPLPTADARASARSKPDRGGDVSGDGSRIRPRAESQFTISLQSAHAYLRSPPDALLVSCWATATVLPASSGSSS